MRNVEEEKCSRKGEYHRLTVSRKRPKDREGLIPVSSPHLSALDWST